MNFDDLDKLFRQKLSQRKAEFDESSWAAMEEMLKKRERKRPRYGWWFILPLLLLLSAGGGYVLLNSGQLTGNKATGQAQQPFAMADSQSVTKQAPKQHTRQNPLTTGINLGIPGSYNPLPGQQRARGSSTANSNPAGHSSPAHKEPPQAGSATATQGGTPNTSGSPERNKTVKASNSRQPALASSLSNPAAVQEGSPAFRREQLHKLPTKLNLLKAHDRTPGEASTIVDSLKASNPDIHEPFELGITGGVQVTARSTGGRLNNLSPGPVAGAYARWHLTGGLFANTALLYHYNRSPGYERAVTQRSYNFGFEAEETTLELQEAHQLQVPLYLDYEVLGSHGITGGVSGTWLVTATGEIMKTRSTSFGMKETTSRTSQLRPEGLKTLQFEAMAGYRFDYSDRLRFQLRGIYSLNQARQDQYESGSSGNYRNTSIQLMLQYQLN